METVVQKVSSTNKTSITATSQMKRKKGSEKVNSKEKRKKEVKKISVEKRN